MSRMTSPLSWLTPALAALAFSSASFATITTTSEAEGPKSREQVQAELDASVRDGSFLYMRHERSYPPQLDPSWHGGSSMPTNLHGTGEINYAAPAAGVQSRDDVRRDLERARADGSLWRLNSNHSDH